MSASIAEALRALEAADPALGSPPVPGARIAAVWTELMQDRDEMVIFETVPPRRARPSARAALIGACVLAVIVTAITVVALRGSGKPSSKPAGPLVIPPGFATSEAQATARAERLLQLVPRLPGTRRLPSLKGAGSYLNCEAPVLCGTAESYGTAPGTVAHAYEFYRSYFLKALGLPTVGPSYAGSPGEPGKDYFFRTAAPGVPIFDVALTPTAGGVNYVITVHVPFYPGRAPVETVTGVQSVVVTTKKGTTTPLPGRTLAGAAAQRLAEAVNNYAVWTPASPGGCNIGYISGSRQPLAPLQVYKAVFTTPTETVSLYGGETCVSVLVRNAKTGVMTYEPDLYGPFGKLVTATLKAR